MDLHGKAGLVTGGTSGLGTAIATRLLQSGANVIVAGRSATGHEDAMAALTKTAQEQGRRILFLQADMARQTECQRLARDAEAELGRIDVLVHSAGAAIPGSLLEIDSKEWMEAFDVHVHAVFHLAKALVPGMQERREGAILLISSAAGMRGCLGALAYGVVKGALPQFARGLARELADFNIRVNCLAPGIVRTPFQDRLTAAQVRNNVENRIPLHREGTPDNVATAALVLIENDFITGETLTVDGGMTMRIV